jgi:hypothetical protein|tara:strand:- start:14957 stop:15217 length:261 start_codon:yes stop_codon:yes gene_type:complete
MATIFRTNNLHEYNIVPDNGEPTYRLAQLQSIVDGYIELVYLLNGQIMVVNEEGLVRQLPVNQAATEIASQLIVGNVILIEGDEIE